MLGQFGGTIKPREGSMLGVLSSGYAREYDSLNGGMTDFVEGKPLYKNDPAGGQGTETGAAPAGFPKAAAGCTQDNKVNDMD